MKVIIFALALVAIVAAAPVEQEPAKILRFDFDRTPEGGYGFDYETENGIKREEVGEVKTVQDEENKPREVVVVRGSFSYTDNQGQPEAITYYADETGFHAEGPSIPVAPVAAVRR